MTWILGIEDTCVYPPAHFEMDPLDEHELTDHNLNWRADLDRVKALGATAVRYGVSWPLVHTAPGVYDWRALDERLRYAAGELDLTVIADLVHYGTPAWLTDSFTDSRYPTAIADFAAAFAYRYRGLVDHLTPLNEPVTTASFSGLRGVWPPGRTGWTGWTDVTLAIVEGIRRTVTAARGANPDIVIVHVEASALYTAGSADLRTEADLLQAIAAVPTDLLLGRIGPDHAMYPWLLEHGATAEVLCALQNQVPVVDLLGVNYYPDLTPRTLRRLDPAAGIEQTTADRWDEGLRACLLHFAGRYSLPILVTETSIEGDDSLRADWVTTSAQALLSLRDEGLDIRGYTWWPLLDFVDWSYASGGRNVEEFALTTHPERRAASTGAQYFADPTAGKAAFLRRMGLLSLVEQPDGTLVRRPTAAGAAFQRLAEAAPVPIAAAEAMP